MRLARPMAALAGHAFTAVLKRQAGVRIVREFLYDIRMAGFAGFGANKLLGIGRGRMGNRRLLRRSASGSRRPDHP